ncbi:ArnT family glycosyltransferase [Gimesia sp.]|uniref:ArnT family glycosyltransferase n=1 Tax=Gimesia sp. TaxID=2024833 RepID=UPI003A94F902
MILNQIKKRNDIYQVLSLFLVLFHAFLLIKVSGVHSPSPLERNLLPAGYYHLKYGRYDIAQVNPPLCRMIFATPLFLFNIDEDWGSLQNNNGSRPEYLVGQDFLEKNGSSIQEILGICRSIAALFSSLAAWCVFLIAKKLYGSLSGFVASIIWCFSPLILGHGQTIGHDLPGASLLALAYLGFMKVLDRGKPIDYLLCGILSGLSFLARTMNIAVIIIWFLVFIVSRGKSPTSRKLVVSSFVFFISILVFNLGYEFSGTFKFLSDYEFCSQSLSGQDNPDICGNRYRNSILGSIPIPLPKDFVVGLDLQKKDFESPAFSSYLCGEWRKHGWWYYYLYAWLVKTPIGFQLIIIPALIFAIKRIVLNTAQPLELYLIIAVLVPFFLTAMQSGFTIHYRYVFSSFPFIAVLASQLWCDKFPLPKFRILFNVLLSYGIISSLLVFPSSISYFNEWVGGATNGGKYLLHSSCDWGQDAYLLKKWYQNYESSGETIFLQCQSEISYYQLGIPKNSIPRRSTLGKRIDNDQAKLMPGYYVISVGFLYGEDQEFRYLDSFEPIEHIGYSIKVYHLTDKMINEYNLNNKLVKELQ